MGRPDDRLRDEAIHSAAGGEVDCFVSTYAQGRFGGLLPGVARAASVDGSLAMTTWRDYGSAGSTASSGHSAFQRAAFAAYLAGEKFGPGLGRTIIRAISSNPFGA